MLFNGRELGVAAWVVAKVCRLVHIDPDSVNVNPGLGGEELSKFVIPVVAYVRVEPVWERRHAGPVKKASAAEIYNACEIESRFAPDNALVD